MGSAVNPKASDATLSSSETATKGGALDEFGIPGLGGDLRSRAVSAGLVTAYAQAAKFVLRLVSVVVLARLLTPEAFGVIGMVLAVTGLLELFKEAGLSTATVQKESITREQVSNLFWINVVLGATITLLCVLIAPGVAWFYHDPRLAPVMVALSLTFLLTGPAVQHGALLRRQLRFGAIAIIDVTALCAGIVASCAMAYSGFGYWSLVGMHLCIAGTRLVLTWVTSGWRPGWPSRQSGVAPLVTFGARLTASDVIGRLAAGSDSILIGRFFGAEALGVYSRGSVLLARPLEQLLSPITSVVVPVLVRVRHDPDRYRRAFLLAYDAVALLVLPAAAMMLVLARPIVLLLLGSEWEAVAPVFAGFTLVAVSLPLSISASWLFLSQGLGRELLRAYAISGAVTVGAVVVGLRWGPLGVVLALAMVSLLVRLPILYFLAGRQGPVTTLDLWTAFLAHIRTWVVVLAAVAVVHSLMREAAPWVQVLVCTSFGVLATGVTVLALRRQREAAAYLWTAVRNRMVAPVESPA